MNIFTDVYSLVRLRIVLILFWLFSLFRALVDLVKFVQLLSSVEHDWPLFESVDDDGISSSCEE